MTDYEKINTAFTAVSTIIQIAGIYFIVKNLKYVEAQLSMSRMAHQETLEWNIKKATEDELLIKPNKKTTKKLTKIFDLRNLKGNISMNKINEEIKNDESVKYNINHVLNRYTRIARGIENGMYSGSIVKDALKNTMIKTYDSYELYIAERQKLNPKAWLSFTKLVKKWKP